MEPTNQLTGAMESGNRFSTEPNTPEPEEDHNGDVARLTPQNELAKTFFNMWVEAYGEQSTSVQAHHSRPFLVFDHARDPTPATSASDSSSSTGSLIKWEGYYRVNFELYRVLERHIVFGAGRSDVAKPSVDLQLSTEKRSRVRGRHGLLGLDLATGLLRITSGNKSKEIQVSERTLQGSGYTFSTSKKSFAIGIGNLTYKLTFLDWKSSTWEKHLGLLREKHGFNRRPTPYLSSTHSDQHFDLGRYTFQEAFDGGSFGRIVPGFNTETGIPVAIKGLLRNRQNEIKLWNELAVAGSLKHV